MDAVARKALRAIFQTASKPCNWEDSVWDVGILPPSLSIESFKFWRGEIQHLLEEFGERTTFRWEVPDALYAQEQELIGTDQSPKCFQHTYRASRTSSPRRSTRAIGPSAPQGLHTTLDRTI
jgi:hypothetical protein